MRDRPDQVLTEIVFSLDTGGAERIAGAIAKYAVASGIRSSICSTHGAMGAIGLELERCGIRSTPLQMGPGGRLGRSIRLIRHLREMRTTVLHVHHFNMLAVVDLAARIAGVSRIVLTEHSTHQLRTKPAVLRRARRRANRADVVTVVHDAQAKFLIDRVGVPADRIRVIPNGVDTTEFRPAQAGTAKHPDLPTARFLVGYVGRLHPDKDPANLLDALQLLPSDVLGETHVVLIGDGVLREEIEHKAKSAGTSEHVTLLGDRQDVSDLLPALDCFVLPSSTEGLPVALLEAMSCGLPVIGTEVGGVPRVIGDAGVTVPPEDPGALAGAMVTLARDPDLRRRLGQSARRRAETNYDRAEMFDAYMEALFPNGGRS